MTDDFSLVVHVADLGPETAHFTVSADGPARDRIADRLGVEAVKSLDAELDVVGGGDRVSLKGRVRAALVRQCVVSLEPMEEEIDETFEIRFERNLTDVEDDDGPIYREPLESQSIDLAEIAVQQVSLAMAPHPRKPDAKPPVPLGAADVIDGPFAALKRLVDDGSESPS